MERKELVDIIDEIHTEIGLSDMNLDYSKSFAEQGYDSLDLTEFIMLIESRLDILVDDHDYNSNMVINDCVNIILRIKNGYKS